MSLAATNAVWRDSRQRGTARLVLLAIADRADDHGVAWPSIRDLAERTLVTVRHVKRIVSALERDGELRVTAGGGRANTNRYELTALNGDAQVTPERVTPVSETVTSEPERVTPRAENGDTHVTRTTKERKSNEKHVARTPRKPDLIWDTLVELIGASPEGMERGRWNKAVQSLKASGATPESLRRAVSAYRTHPTYADCALTVTALASNWTTLTANGKTTVDLRNETLLADIALLEQRRNGAHP